MKSDGNPSKKQPKRYALDQSAFYKVESRAALASKLRFDDVHSLERLAVNTGNYQLFTVYLKPRIFGGEAKARDVQKPQKVLEKVHRRIASLLTRIETPPYVHSAVRKRSYITNARTHVSCERLIKVDIRKFYESTTRQHVLRFFLEVMRCSIDVAELLTRLCTFQGKLPTGSPLSPILSYWVHSQMFDEISKLASARGLTFTCYVDDLALSGLAANKALIPEIAAILKRNSLRLHDQKSRYFGIGSAKLVTGLILKDGALALPHVRFQNIRLVEVALSTETDCVKRLALSEVLNGMVGEASQIHADFKPYSRLLGQQVALLRATAI